MPFGIEEEGNMFEPENHALWQTTPSLLLHVTSVELAVHDYPEDHIMTPQQGNVPEVWQVTAKSLVLHVTWAAKAVDID